MRSTVSSSPVDGSPLIPPINFFEEKVREVALGPIIIEMLNRSRSMSGDRAEIFELLVSEFLKGDATLLYNLRDEDARLALKILLHVRSLPIKANVSAIYLLSIGI